MKTAFALLLFLVPVFAADSSGNKEITSVVDSWKSAVLNGDAAALDKLYHADLTYTQSSGKTETKAEAIAASTKPGSLTKAVEILELSPRIYGKTAVVKMKGNLTSADGTVNHLDILMVWIKSAQGWQLVARQSTKLQ